MQVVILFAEQTDDGDGMLDALNSSTDFALGEHNNTQKTVPTIYMLMFPAIEYQLNTS